MDRGRSRQLPKQKNGAVGERKKPTIPPRNPAAAAAAAAPSSSSSSNSYSPLSSRQSESPSQSTRASTPVTIQQDSRNMEIQLIQDSSDSSNNAVAQVTISVLGQLKMVLSVENRTDQQLSTVQNSNESVGEEKRTDDTQIELETEIEKLKMEVKNRTSEVDGLRAKVKEQEIQLRDKTSELERQTSELNGLRYNLREANEECTENARGSEVLRKGITGRIFDVMNFLQEHAFRKDVYEKWQDQEMPDDGSIVKGELTERQKGLDSIWMEDYLFMYGEIDRLMQALENEKKTRSEDIQRLQRELSDQVACEREIRDRAEERITQLELENRHVSEQLALEREKREKAEEQARERAAEERAAQQQRFTQLEREHQHVSEQLALEREKREEAEEEARERAAEERAARAENDNLTQENNALRTQVEGLENQQNELQQRNNALEAQRRDDVDVIVAILHTQELQENVIAYQYNEALRQHDITKDDNEQLVQVLVNTLNQHEDELAIVLCQMAEINDSTQHIPEANDNNPPQLRLARVGSQLQSESLTPGRRWQQTIASRYAQRSPNSLAGLMVRLLHFTTT